MLSQPFLKSPGVWEVGRPPWNAEARPIRSMRELCLSMQAVQGANRRRHRCAEPADGAAGSQKGSTSEARQGHLAGGARANVARNDVKHSRQPPPPDLGGAAGAPRRCCAGCGQWGQEIPRAVRRRRSSSRMCVAQEPAGGWEVRDCRASAWLRRGDHIARRGIQGTTSLC